MWGHVTAEEASLFDDIFRSISTQPWCGKLPAEREWLANQILSFYRRGISDPIDLWSACDRIARARFSLDAR